MMKPVRPRRISPAALFSGRRGVLLALDIVVLTGAFWLAYQLRFDFAVPEAYQQGFLRQLPVVVSVQIAALFAAGIPLFIWRYIGLRELRAFAAAAAFATTPLLLLRVALPQGWELWRTPVSIIFVDAILAFGGALATRIGRRLVYERGACSLRARLGSELGRRVVLVGAGHAGILASREIQLRGDTGLELVCFVDDDPLKQGMVINGVRVMGTTRDLATLGASLELDQALITIASLTASERRRLEGLCTAAGLASSSMPGLYEVLQGKVSVEHFKRVKLEELLSRDVISLDSARVHDTFHGKRVMVTGAGGSIGSELARQVIDSEPAELLLVERAEFALFEVTREISGRVPTVDVVPVVADVGDRKRMRSVFSNYKPQIVIHAAAHKHVPLLEQNAADAVRNNVLATHSLGVLSGQFGVERFVLISTDKAVNPTSVMGATKRMAELVIQELNREYETSYCAVRFGNVLGSVGSVVPIFQAQIRSGGPVTVTHPDMERYFMTIPEAVTLVLEASAMGHGGEIFILDMGEPVRVVDIAKRLIELHGMEPDVDIAIEYIGVRPGEKLVERVSGDRETLAPTDHPKIWIGQIRSVPSEAVKRALQTMDNFALGVDADTIRAFMNDFLQEGNLACRPSGLAREA